ncbi:hypothetical protein JX265_003650 [Neoarthrinium moseri]|uniref:Uncharacterized protein n=1 Tax=Neoarthrinium moseri TaxID=1658444 RepID=A0A9Q0AS05_9PEZI|nr:uncharacterized protein JN550_002395 [Neoarthrinium moseri]KAI1874966.1 hypothetical protein JN550_002395 [Neoarthrinium moseri]KAI1877642.1 hypothetical protein JX265_003650 [Neoarthrinium moseri]
MPAGNEAFTALTPRQAFALARSHAELLRQLFNHPEFKYTEPPTSVRYPVDVDRTPPALLMVSDFVQTTYVEHVLPLLPAGTSRKCKDVGNPWAFADPNYSWEWTWDESAGELRDAQGAKIDFPVLPKARAIELRGDVYSRSFMAHKCICENDSDVKARMMIGGQSFDFGEEARRIIKSLEQNP